jgi:hypothetical protein
MMRGLSNRTKKVKKTLRTSHERNLLAPLSLEGNQVDKVEAGPSISHGFETMPDERH